MELRLNPWQRFLVVSVLIAIGTIYFVAQGGITWYLTHFTGAANLWSTVILLIICTLIFVAQGGGGAYIIQQEKRALLQLKCDGQFGVTTLPSSRLRTILDDFLACCTIESTRKMKIDAFVEAYETELMGPISALQRGSQTLMTLGIFGTVVGIVQGLASNDTAQLLTAEGVQSFSLTALLGVGLSYMTTLIALFGAIVINYLQAGYEPVVQRMVAEFGLLLERQLLVINPLTPITEEE